MDDNEVKKLAAPIGELYGWMQIVSNCKSAGRGAALAKTEYKDHKKDQPSWKVLAGSFEDVAKLVSPTLKVIDQIFDLGSKKKSEKLSLADAKKEIKGYIPKLQKMDDAFADVLESIGKVEKELGQEIGLTDARKLKNEAKVFFEKFAKFKIEVNKL